MDEYISREAVVRYLKEYSEKECNSNSPYGLITSSVLNKVERALSEMPAADVKLISQWISVKDMLPEPEKDVLVWYRYTWGAGFTAYRFGISRWYSNIKRWYEGCLPKDIEVLYWQSLPEPPKNGDAT